MDFFGQHVYPTIAEKRVWHLKFSVSNYTKTSGQIKWV